MKLGIKKITKNAAFKGSKIINTMKEVEIEYGHITCEKIVKGVWVAKTQVTKPLKVEIKMSGSSEKEALKKLEYFLHPKEIENE